MDKSFCTYPFKYNVRAPYHARTMHLEANYYNYAPSRVSRPCLSDADFEDFVGLKVKPAPLFKGAPGYVKAIYTNLARP